MKIDTKIDPEFNFMHIDPTLIRTRTCKTLLNILAACHNSVDKDLKTRIDYVINLRKKEMGK